MTEAELFERAARIRCLFLDVDGVLTDGKLYIAPDGSEWKTSSVRDGHGIKLMQAAGVEVAAISGRPPAGMGRRLEALGLRHMVFGHYDKLPAYEEIRSRLGLADAECAAMGDDVPDLPLMRRAGLALTVADAHPQVLAAAHWVSRYPGGAGAVREACDLILAAHGRAER